MYYMKDTKLLVCVGDVCFAWLCVLETEPTLPVLG